MFAQAVSVPLRSLYNTTSSFRLIRAPSERSPLIRLRRLSSKYEAANDNGARIVALRVRIESIVDAVVRLLRPRGGGGGGTGPRFPVGSIPVLREMCSEGTILPRGFLLTTESDQYRTDWCVLSPHLPSRLNGRPLRSHRCLSLTLSAQAWRTRPQ